MKKFLKFEDSFSWLLIMWILFIIFASLTTCKSATVRTPEKQVEENNAAIELNDEASEVVKNSDLPKKDKRKIFSALATSEKVINQSTETINDCIKFKSQAIAKNHAYQETIKKQGRGIFYLILIIIALCLPWIYKLIIKINPSLNLANKMNELIQKAPWNKN